MAGSKDLDIALLIKAQASQAKAQLAQVRAELTGVGEASAKASATSAAAAKTAETASKSEAAAVAQVVTAQTARGETEEEARARIHAMVQASTQAAEADGARAAAAMKTAGSLHVAADANSALGKSTAGLVAAQDAQMVNFGKFSGAAKDAAAATAALKSGTLTSAAFEKAVNDLGRAVDVGAISQVEYVAALKLADKAKIKDIALTEAQSAANKSAALNSRAVSEIGTAASEVLAGNFGRLRRTGAAFANQAGIIQKLMSPTALAIEGVAAAVAGLTAVMVSAERETSAFNDVIAQTGGYTGTTVEGLREMAASLQASGVSIRRSNADVLEIARTGRFSGDQIRQVAQAVSDMARATGASFEEATKQALHLAEDPIAGLEQLQRTTHQVSIEVLDQARAYVEVGDKEDAARLAINEYGRIAQTVLSQHEQDLGTVRTFWEDVKTAISNATAEVLDFGDKNRHAMQLAAARAVLEQNIAAGNVQRNEAGAFELTARGKSFASIGEAEGANVFGGALTARLAGAVDIYKQLGGAAEDAKQAAAATAAQTQKINEAGYAASVSIAGLAKGYDKAADHARAVKKVTDLLTAELKAGRDLPSGVLAAPAGTDKFDFSGKGFDYLVAKAEGASGGARAATPRVDHTAEQIARAAAAAQQALTQALIQQQAALSPTAAIWATYNKAVEKANDDAAKAKLAHGANAQAIDAQKQAVIDLAGTIRDNALDALVEKDRQAWENLRRSMESPIDAKIDAAIDKIKQLNEAMKQGVGNADEYHQLLKSVGENSVTPLPQYHGLDAAVGGIGSELTKNYEKQKATDAAYLADKLALQKKYDDSDLAQAEAHKAALAKLDKDYKDQNARIERDRGTLQLQTASDLFGQLATLSSSHNKKMAAIGKAAAIAQTVIKTYQSATEAYASLAGIPYIGPALGAAAAAVAIAAGLANVAQIRSQGVGGYASGGQIRGAGTATSDSIPILASNREFMQPVSAVDHYGVGFMEAVRTRRFPKYAEGGLIGPAPTPAQLGFTARRQPRMDFSKLAAANDARMGAPQLNVKNVVVFDRDQLAEQLMNTPAGHKVIVHVVGDNPRTIQGKWQAG